MMKRIFCLVLIMLFLCACSVQEKISPIIFMERIIKADENITADTDNAFSENNNYVCFAKYSDKTDIVFEIASDEQGNATKINLACTQTDKVDDFINCAISIASTYAPDDDAKAVADVIFESKKLSDTCFYHETQWHSYSAVISENGLFFSVQSKKLVPQSEVEFSLKQNDIVEY